MEIVLVQHLMGSRHADILLLHELSGAAFLRVLVYA